MGSGQQYGLWFVNQSSNAGKACVYQDQGNAAAQAAKVLAWMVTGANPSVQVNFVWALDYDFAWFDYDAPRSQGISSAGLTADNSVAFARNQYGYYFQAPTAGTSGQLSIRADGSIPSVNNTLVGIGMHGAGTFACPAGPNLNYAFTPVQDAILAYWISFGSYSFDVGDPVDPSTLNNPGKIIFPYGVYVMTAVLNSQNLWSIHAGPPGNAAQVDVEAVVYEAGKGLLTSA